MTSAQDEDPQARPSAGPVGAGDPPPPAVAKASSGEGSPTPPPAGDASEQNSEGAEVERDLEELLADTQRERDGYLELAKRAQADFENYRKRMAAEVQAAAARGKAEVVREVIDAVDNLERALEAAGQGTDDLAGGVELVLKGLRETLVRHGVEAVDPKGEKFDPQLHEALSTAVGNEAESGTVIEVMQKGYLLGEQLVRPARVVVAE